MPRQCRGIAVIRCYQHYTTPVKCQATCQVPGYLLAVARYFFPLPSARRASFGFILTRNTEVSIDSFLAFFRVQGQSHQQAGQFIQDLLGRECIRYEGQ